MIWDALYEIQYSTVALTVVLQYGNYHNLA